MLNIRRQKNEKSREYHTDLEAQAKERYELRKHNQEEQRVKSVEVSDRRKIKVATALCPTSSAAGHIVHVGQTSKIVYYHCY